MTVETTIEVPEILRDFILQVRDIKISKATFHNDDITLPCERRERELEGQNSSKVRQRINMIIIKLITYAKSRERERGGKIN